MNTTYKRIFSIELKHEYYADGQANELSLKASPETDLRLQQMGCRMIQKGNVVSLFAPESFDLAGFAGANPDVNLTFSLDSSNPYFINFTDIPMDDAKQALVFTNESTEANEGTVQALSSSFKENKSGLQQLVLIQLSMDNLAAAKRDNPLEFSLDLPNRAVAWRIYIINQSQLAGQLTLSGKGSELFSGSVKTDMPDGSVAQMFDSSPNPIPFKAVPALELNLEVSEVDKASEVKIGLPCPGPERLQLEESAGKRELYAAAYVYI